MSDTHHRRAAVKQLVSAVAAPEPCGSEVSRARFPNVVVRTHEHERALFYNDLLRDRLVLLHFFSVEDEANYPVLANIAQVQAHLGRDSYLYSITSDPQHDTPAVLAALAQKYQAGRAWKLLGGAPEAVAAIYGVLFPGDAHCSRGLMRYGNEAAGIWGSVPARSDPRAIAERLEWVRSRPPPSGERTPRRAGPKV